ncbi:response regulator [Roseococcus sp. YIM B11640]|uniref:response regulator n=1 Tax=Roseococcus sp. YIM B11640 TaxID=3133973 RepID=UPI003C7A8951
MIADLAPKLKRPRRLEGCRVLVVEDDFFQADDLSCALRDYGAEVVGPAATYEDGLLMLVAGGRIDVALLDINLGGEMAYPLADILLDSGVDVVLATGYDLSAVPGRFLNLARVEKPFDAGTLALNLPELIRYGRRRRPFRGGTPGGQRAG